MNPLNTPAKRPQSWKVIEEICDVLRDNECSLEKASHLLRDALIEYDAQLEDRYQKAQEALMESGGPDDSAYRADLENAGRGHLVKP